MSRPIDHSGKRFGKLNVLHKILTEPHKKAKYLCVCDCGNEMITTSSNLVTGHVKSCGCLSKKHGLAHKERLYNIWIGMRQRCRDINRPDYPRYGGRGIAVCDEWDENYLSFREWALSNGYSDILSIDRINQDGNYEPANCRWETYIAQNNNKKGNRIINHNGKKRTLSELARIHEIPYKIVNQRFQRGWDINRIISTPIKKRGDANAT